VLFFLERLALVHEAFILAAHGGVGKESVNAFANAASLDVFNDGLAEFACFGFNFVGHKYADRIKHSAGGKAIRNVPGIWIFGPVIMNKVHAFSA
jgi:hypothetical protein